MTLIVSSVVEGHGEVEAVPLLIRRILAQVRPTLDCRVLAPLRVSRSKLLREGELERAVELAGRRATARGAVLVLLDAERDCPARRGPEILERATRARPYMPLKVVLAKAEFESWFLAAAESIAGRRDLPLGLTAPADPEAIRGAKEWLSARMPAGRSYRETRDQAALTAVFDLEAAKARSPSLRKLWRDIESLAGIERPGGA